jgi:replication factor A1
MESSLIHFSFVYIRSIRVVELEVVLRSAALTKDTSTLLHAQASTSQSSSSSAADTLPAVVTPPTTGTTTTIPFTALSPYRKYWSIQGRASAKTSLKAYTNARGSGKVFGFDLINRDREEIHLSAFAALAESLYNLIQVGQLYIVSNGTVKEANPIYNHLNNKWEIYLFAASTIHPCPTDDPTFPYQSFHFKTIAEVKNAPPNMNVDVIGVVTSTSPASTIRRKDGSETLRKTLILKDKSGFSIDVTLWGDHCDYIGQNLSEFYSFDNPPILAIKGGRVSAFNGTTIGTIPTSTLIINPQVEETHQLHAWFRETGYSSSSPSLSRNYGVASKRALPQKTLSEISSMQLSDKAIWVSVRATSTSLDMDDFYFLACPLDFNGKQCMKKVVEHSNNLWHCTKCNGSFPECDYRYKLKIELHDHTGTLQNVTVFNDAGNELMGITAKDLFLLSIEPSDMQEICGRISGQRFKLTLSIKSDYFNGVQRLQPILVNSEEIQYASACKEALTDIQALSTSKRPIVRRL